MSRAAQSWSVIILCYNEEKTIQHVTEKTADVLKSLAPTPTPSEIILVDDGSRDGSAEIIRRLASKDGRIRAVFLEKNQGYGGALRAGYAAAKHENVCAIPGDGQFDPVELIGAAAVAPGTFVSFSRIRQDGYGWHRRVVSRFNRWVNERIFGFAIKDVNWVKVYKRDAMVAVEPKLKSMLVNSEIGAKLLLSGARCLEIPSIYQPRRAGKSKAGSISHVVGAIRELTLLGRELVAFRQRLRTAAKSKNPDIRRAG